MRDVWKGGSCLPYGRSINLCVRARAMTARDGKGRRYEHEVARAGAA